MPRSASFRALSGHAPSRRKAMSARSAASLAPAISEFDGVAAEIIRRSHALPAGSLQLRQQHKLAVPAGDGQALLREGDRAVPGALSV